jgi:hypothetical protein
MRFLGKIVLVLSGWLFLGCGGSGSSSGPPGALFNIASGNWRIPLTSSAVPNDPAVGGMLTQNGTSISGVLRVNGSPCFDPIIDQLMVSGSITTDPQNQAGALSLSTAPIRGQVLTVSAEWDRTNGPTLPPLTSPPNPVDRLFGDVTLTGGACATSVSLVRIYLANYAGTWSGRVGGPTWQGNLTATISQSGPDAQGLFHVSGTFAVSGSPCFTSGVIDSNSFAGDIESMTVTMDSGQLVGTARRIVIIQAAVDNINLDFVVHGGSCDGQKVTGSIFHG